MEKILKQWGRKYTAHFIKTVKIQTDHRRPLEKFTLLRKMFSLSKFSSETAQNLPGGPREARGDGGGPRDRGPASRRKRMPGSFAFYYYSPKSSMREGLIARQAGREKKGTEGFHLGGSST